MAGVRIGITGGIGSGKSYVSRMLSERFHVPVYDSDAEARRLMIGSARIRKSLGHLLVTEPYFPDGSLDKERLARYLFANADNAARVNGIVHPVVKDDFLSWASERKGLVALESAILVEAGFLDVVDCVLLVEAPENLRLQRAMHRDGATEEQVRQRMARQASDEERRAASDFIIVNDGRDIQQQLSFFIESLLGQLSY